LKLPYSQAALERVHCRATSTRDATRQNYFLLMDTARYPKNYSETSRFGPRPGGGKWS